MSRRVTIIDSGATEFGRDFRQGHIGLAGTPAHGRYLLCQTSVTSLTGCPGNHGYGLEIVVVAEDSQPFAFRGRGDQQVDGSG
jgi:hypothetical protein